jgi:hypothetical protein
MQLSQGCSHVDSPKPMATPVLLSTRRNGQEDAIRETQAMAGDGGAMPATVGAVDGC